VSRAEFTELIREGNDPLWRRLRELLRQRGIDPQTAELAESFEDDEFYEFGVLVTADGRRYEFEIDYAETPIAEAVFAEWRETSGR
jgi:hypothetical protein